MKKTYADLFQELGQASPPERLSGSIILRVHILQKHRAERRFAALSLVSLFSFALAIPALLNLISSTSASGFFAYISLAFSDGSTLALYWKELALTLAESIPVFGSIIFLSLVSIFIWSGARAVQGAKSVFLTA